MIQPGVRLMEEDALPRKKAKCLRSAEVSSELDRLGEVRAIVDDLAHEAMLDEDRTYDLKVAVSEACANAIEHSPVKEKVTLSAWLDRQRLLVEVRHPGAFEIHPGSGGTRHRGLGLPLMVALMDEVKISRPPDGGTCVALSVFLA